MYTHEDILKVQARLLTMAKAIKDVLESHNIPYMITVGTLLGAVRHKGFIPWDDDFDFHLFNDSYDQAINALRKELPNDLFVENKDTEPLYFHDWAHVKDLNSETKCDLFPQDGIYAHHGISIDLYRWTKIKACELSLYRFKLNIEYLQRKNISGLISDEELYEKSKLLNKQIAEQKTLLKNSEGLDLSELYASTHSSIFKNEMFPLKYYRFEDTEFLGPNDADTVLTRRYGNYMELPPIEQRHPHYSEVTFLK